MRVVQALLTISCCAFSLLARAECVVQSDAGADVFQLALGVEKVVSQVPLNFPLFRNGHQPASFRLKTKNGSTPKITILNKNFVQRALAQSLNVAQRAMESDPTRRELINLTDSITMSFEGIVFSRSDSTPDSVQVTLIGRTSEVDIPQTISLKDLERGKEIVVNLPERSKSMPGMEVKGTGRLVFSYDPDRGRLNLRSASGTIEVGGQLDSGATSGVGDFDPNLRRKFKLPVL